MPSQQALIKLFRDLHKQGDPIVLFNIWDAGSAKSVSNAGAKALATGSAPDANIIPVPKAAADLAMDAAACIGCGACVASCPNGAAMLFTSAKISQLALLPQGQAERQQRAIAMVAQMDKEGFGNCTNAKECEAVCPKGISIRNIARLNREYLLATLIEG